MTEQNKNEIKWKREFYKWAEEKYQLDFRTDPDSPDEAAYLAARKAAQVEIDELTWLCENLSSDLKDREEMTREAIDVLNYFGGDSYIQFEKEQSWLEKAKRLTGEIK